MVRPMLIISCSRSLLMQRSSKSLSRRIDFNTDTSSSSRLMNPPISSMFHLLPKLCRTYAVLDYRKESKNIEKNRKGGVASNSLNRAGLLESTTFCGARNRNRTGTTCLRSTDFKSVVSTNFTTRADGCRRNVRSGIHERRIIQRQARGEQKQKYRSNFLDTKFDIHIMRTSFFAGIAQLVERYLAKV